jgi:ankyrin repeat protein
MKATEMSNDLHWCTEYGDLEKVKQLVEGGANIEESQFGKTALIVASLKGYFEIVVYLVEHGANVAHFDKDGKTALHWACDGRPRDLSLVIFLLEHGASVADRDSRGMTAFLYAARKRKFPIGRLLGFFGGRRKFK